MKRVIQRFLAPALCLALLCAAAPALADDGDPVPVSVTLADTLTMNAGTTRTLAATITYDDESTSSDASLLIWTSSSEGVATVSAAGAVTAHGAGSATITATVPGVTVSGNPVSASCAVTVEGVSIAASLTNGRLAFSSLMNGAYTTLGGSALSYISGLTVPTVQGTLYDGYVSEADPGAGVSSATRYYTGGSGARLIKNITFIPKADYTGEVAITFTAFSASGASFPGRITLNLTTAAASLSYASDEGKPVQFRAEDFSAYALGTGRRTIRYVSFTLPAARQGTLYYNYIDGDIHEGPVTANTLYYRTSSPYLDKVWFVPNPTFSGDAYVYFSACDTAGTTFSGSVRITVSNAAGTTGGADVSYSAVSGGYVYFNAADFDAACRERLGSAYALDYVYFTSLPSPSRGTLYCDGYGAAATGYAYYRAASAYNANRRLLSSVYFAGNASFASGTVSVPFTAYATSGDSFTGTVRVTVRSAASQSEQVVTSVGGMIAYGSDGRAVAFRAQDFYDDAAKHLAHALSTVRFYTPDAKVGRLCLSYVSPTSYTILDASQDYAPADVSRVSFQPRAGLEGAAYVRFFASDVTGKSYTGTLAVNVSPPTASRFFDDMSGFRWAVPSADFLAYYGIVGGADYRAFSPAAQTRRGDFAAMLVRCFGFYGAPGMQVFSDVPPEDFYAPYVNALYAAGIASGDENGAFRPYDPLTRQDAAVFLYRCMKAAGTLADGGNADLAVFIDRTAIAPYARIAVATLARLGVLEGNNGWLYPNAPLTRAEMVCMFHRALT